MDGLYLDSLWTLPAISLAPVSNECRWKRRADRRSAQFERSAPLNIRLFGPDSRGGLETPLDEIMAKRTTAVPTPSYRGPGEASRLRRLIWAVAKCMGIRGQQWLWNNQFRGGYWNHIGQKKNEETVAYVKKYLLGGRLVEFGCGEGLLPQALDPQTYQSYEGLDISRVAIERARSRNLPNCTFKVCRLEDWPGDREVSLCVAEEVLYYLKPDDQRRLLAKCLSSLTPEGSILVIVHDKVLHAATLDLVRSCGAVREEREINGRSIVVIGPR